MSPYKTCYNSPVLPVTKSDFTLVQELGLRLRELRQRAGLSLAQVARRMSRSRGFAAYLSLLERGRLKAPGVTLVAEYLRACRASMTDIVSVFDRYTSQPTLIEEAGAKAVRQVTTQLPVHVAGALERYDVKTTHARILAGEEPSDPKERELRIRKQAQAWVERGRLDRIVHREMDNLGVLPVLAVRKVAFDYAHRVWRILRTTRAVPGQGLSRRRKPRDLRLAQAEEQALKLEVIPLEGLRLIARVTTALFEQMERLGELDILPGLAAVPYIQKPLSSFCRVRRSEVAAVVPGLPYRAEYLSAVKLDAVRQLEAAGIVGDRLRRYLQWLGQIEAVALSTGPDSDERARRIDELVNGAHDPAQARAVAEVYLATFERWRPRLYK